MSGQGFFRFQVVLGQTVFEEFERRRRIVCESEKVQIVLAMTPCFTNASQLITSFQNFEP